MCLQSSRSSIKLQSQTLVHSPAKALPTETDVPRETTPVRSQDRKSRGQSFSQERLNFLSSNHPKTQDSMAEFWELSNTLQAGVRKLISDKKTNNHQASKV
mmetsp:Transcript_46890/g.34325  ORF Transcript_46890/g.34325 Transcript_46890/m.34325 type:complete len:101 (-) Transcript_46890:522-824(-)